MSDFLDNLKNDHSDFAHGKLDGQVPANPFVLFEKWYEEAFQNETEANAMTISTVNAEGIPSSRIVYLKEIAEERFVFFTNYNSHKGHDLTQNPNIALSFFWKELQRQVRVVGVAQKSAAQVSDDYFATRPRMSQLGAWASHQSEALTSREELERRMAELEVCFPTDVPRPEHWGGYDVIPQKIEFWQGRPSRLHDRVVYEFQDGQWNTYRINP